MKKLHTIKDIFLALCEEKPTFTRACILGASSVLLYYVGILAIHLFGAPEKILTTTGLLLFWLGLLWVFTPLLTECIHLVRFVFAYIREYYIREE